MLRLVQYTNLFDWYIPYWAQQCPINLNWWPDCYVFVVLIENVNHSTVDYIRESLCAFVSETNYPYAEVV